MPYGYANQSLTPTGNTRTSTGETFIQRQQRLQQGTSQTAPDVARPTSGSTSSSSYAAPAAGSTGTPVSGNGSIPPPTPAAPAAPAPAPAAPAPMSTQQKEAAAGIKDMGNNMVFVPGYGGTVDRNSPWYTQAMQQYDAANPGGAGGGGTAAPLSEQVARGSMSQGPFTQYQAPDHDFENWQQLQLIDNILANPDTLSQHVIDQLQQKSTEEALSMNKQLADQQREDLAGRGMSLTGGMADAQARQRNEDMTNAILGKRRDIEIAAAQQNRQDELNALQGAEGILQGQTGRAGQVYSDILQGEGANADDAIKKAQLALQDKLGMGGLGIDQNRLNEQTREFNTSFPLSILQFLEGQRQFNDNQGLQYTQLGQQGQQSAIDRIMAALGI